MKEKEDEKNFRLRLPPELFDRLEWVANEEGRSINRQIVKMLQEAVERWQELNPKSGHQATVEALVA